MKTEVAKGFIKDFKDSNLNQGFEQNSQCISVTVCCIVQCLLEKKRKRRKEGRKRKKREKKKIIILTVPDVNNSH